MWFWRVLCARRDTKWREPSHLYKSTPPIFRPIPEDIHISQYCDCISSEIQFIMKDFFFTLPSIFHENNRTNAIECVDEFINTIKFHRSCLQLFECHWVVHDIFNDINDVDDNNNEDETTVRPSAQRPDIIYSSSNMRCKKSAVRLLQLQWMNIWFSNSSSGN